MKEVQHEQSDNQKLIPVGQLSTAPMASRREESNTGDGFIDNRPEAIVQRKMKASIQQATIQRAMQLQVEQAANREEVGESEVLQLKKIGTVTSKTNLRLDPEDPDSQTGIYNKRMPGFNKLIPEQDVFEINQEDIKSENQKKGGLWNEVTLLSGTSLGSEGYVRANRTNTQAPYGEIEDDELTTVIGKGGLYTAMFTDGNPAKKMTVLYPGTLVKILDEDAVFNFYHVQVLSEQKGKIGYFRGSKMQSSFGESLDDFESGAQYSEAQIAKPYMVKLSGSNLRRAPEQTVEEIEDASDINTKLQANQNLDLIGTHSHFIKNKSLLLIEKLKRQANVQLNIEKDLNPILKKQLQQLIENKAAEVLGGIDSACFGANSIIHHISTSIKRSRGADLPEGWSEDYEDARQKLDTAQNLFEELTSEDPNENCILKITSPQELKSANEKFNKDPSFWQKLKSNVKETTLDTIKGGLENPGSIISYEDAQNAAITGSPAELGGGYQGGVRTVVASGGINSKGQLNANDSYQNGKDGAWADRPDSGVDLGENILTSDYGVTQEVAEFFNNSIFGKFYDPRNFGLTFSGKYPTGFKFTLPKIFFIRPYPPLAQIEFPIPLYPGIGVSLSAKATANAWTTASFAGTWGNTYSKKIEARANLQETQKQRLASQRLLNSVNQALEIETVLGKQVELTEQLEAEKTKLSKLKLKEIEFSKQAEKSDIEIGISGKNLISGALTGEIFGGIMLGIPVANITGGVYGALTANLGADIGFNGSIKRTSGKWSLDLNDTFNIKGGILAEVGLKAGISVLFFSGDIAKFKIADWTIASFALGAKYGTENGFELTSKEIKWFDKTRPPIETQVEQAKGKAQDEREKVLDEFQDDFQETFVGKPENYKENLGNLQKELALKLNEFQAEYENESEGGEDGGAVLKAETSLESLEHLQNQINGIEQLKKKLKDTAGKYEAHVQELEKIKNNLNPSGMDWFSHKLKEKTPFVKTPADLNRYEERAKDYLAKAYQLRGESERQTLPLYREYNLKLEALKKEKSTFDQHLNDTNIGTLYGFTKEMESLEVEKKRLLKEQSTLKKEEKNANKKAGPDKESQAALRKERMEFSLKNEKLSRDLKTLELSLSSKKKQIEKLEKIDKIKTTAYQKAYRAYQDAEKSFDGIKNQVGDTQSLLARASGHVERAKNMYQSIQDLKNKFKDLDKLKQDASQESEMANQESPEYQTARAQVASGIIDSPEAREKGMSNVKRFGELHRATLHSSSKEHGDAQFILLRANHLIGNAFGLKKEPLKFAATLIQGFKLFEEAERLIEKGNEQYKEAPEQEAPSLLEQLTEVQGHLQGFNQAKDEFESLDTPTEQEETPQLLPQVSFEQTVSNSSFEKLLSSHQDNGTQSKEQGAPKSLSLSPPVLSVLSPSSEARKKDGQQKPFDVSAHFASQSSVKSSSSLLSDKRKEPPKLSSSVAKSQLPPSSSKESSSLSVGQVEHAVNSCYIAALLHLLTTTRGYSRLLIRRNEQVPPRVETYESILSGLISTFSNPNAKVKESDIEKLRGQLLINNWIIPGRTNNARVDQQDASEVLTHVLGEAAPEDNILENTITQRPEAAAIQDSRNRFTLQLPIDDKLIRNIDEALINYCKKEKIEDVGSKTNESERHIEFVTLPRTLTIVLKRFSYDRISGASKIEKPVSAPTTLVIPQACLHANLRDRRMQYKLSNFVHHAGGVGGGHYTAFGKDKEGWYQSDDMSKTGDSRKKLREREFQQYLNTAYIYVYELEEN